MTAIVDTLMSQMERVTTEMEHLRQQSATNTSDWHRAASRVSALEAEVVRLAQGATEGRKELNFVDIKTMKPPVFAKPTDSFQAWVKKAKNYLEANCEGIKEARRRSSSSRSLCPTTSRAWACRTSGRLTGS